MLRIFICGGLWLLIASASHAQPSAQRPAHACLNYEPEVVTLTGTIRKRTFAGPPNYESLAKGDKREDVWLLRLAKPLCVAANDEARAETNLTELQLVFVQGQKQYDEYRSLKGRRVSVTGTLFHAITAHHHTRVLVTVTSITKA